MPLSGKLSLGLSEKLGEEVASGLINAFNEMEVAHRTEFQELRHDIARLENRVVEFRAELKQDITALRFELKQDMAAMRGELLQKIAGVQSELIKWTFVFWLGTIGIVVYMVSMWVAGVTQGLMLRAFDAQGFLVYGNFTETVLRVLPLYYIRAFGGLLYLIGMLMLVVNVWVTVRGATPVPDEEASAPALQRNAPPDRSWQRRLEAHPLQFALWALIAVSIGGLVELVPLLAAKSNVPVIASVKPYTPLELEGRDLYVREGCYLCHSQMIRPFRAETERYGDYSKAGEFVYDHPFQFGSRRIGPDLQRIGGKYPNIWHYRHMEDPRSTSPGSIMPPFAWLLADRLNTSDTVAKLRAMRTLGVPYTPEEVDNAVKDLQAQAQAIATDLATSGVQSAETREIVALIAYLQRMGTDIKKAPLALAEPRP